MNDQCVTKLCYWASHNGCCLLHKDAIAFSRKNYMYDSLMICQCAVHEDGVFWQLKNGLINTYETATNWSLVQSSTDFFFQCSVLQISTQIWSSQPGKMVAFLALATLGKQPDRHWYYMVFEVPEAPLLAKNSFTVLTFLSYQVLIIAIMTAL